MDISIKVLKCFLSIIIRMTMGFFEDERRIGKNIFVYYEILEALEEI